jgi:hypothetical protein
MFGITRTIKSSFGSVTGIINTANKAVGIGNKGMDVLDAQVDAWARNTTSTIEANAKEALLVALLDSEQAHKEDMRAIKSDFLSSGSSEEDYNKSLTKAEATVTAVWTKISLDSEQ